MAMHTETLSSAWYEFTNLDDDRYVMAVLAGDDCDVITASEEPDVDATSFTISAGISRLDIPEGSSLWIRCPSGTCELTYSKFGGIIMDPTKCACAYTDSASLDVVVNGTSGVIVGNIDTDFDDLSYVGFLHSVPAGIPNSGVESAMLRLTLNPVKANQVLRIHGVASSTSQFASLTDFASVAVGLPLTTSFVDVTVGNSGSESVDIASILSELITVSGWDETSPVQLLISNISGVPSGANTTMSIAIEQKQPVIFARLS